jgi:hypothetical protein
MSIVKFSKVITRLALFNSATTYNCSLFVYVYNYNTIDNPYYSDIKIFLIAVNIKKSGKYIFILIPDIQLNNRNIVVKKEYPNKRIIRISFITF